MDESLGSNGAVATGGSIDRPDRNERTVTDGGDTPARPSRSADVEVATDLSAATDRVWSVLTAPEAYERWNTLFELRGTLAEGERLWLRLSLPGLPPAVTRPRVVGMAPDRELRWVTRWPGLRAVHVFELEPIVSGTRFRQAEWFTGMLAEPVLARVGRQIERGFDMFNRDLARHLERTAAGRSRG